MLSIPVLLLVSVNHNWVQVLSIPVLLLVSVNHNWVQVLSIPVLLLVCSRFKYKNKERDNNPKTMKNKNDKKEMVIFWSNQFEKSRKIVFRQERQFPVFHL